MNDPHCHHFRVYYEDTDASGVMYHARYLGFFERARTEFLRALGFEQQRLMEQHAIAFTLTELSIRYRRPARLDDELIIHTRVEQARSASIRFQQSMHRAEDAHGILAELSVRAGCVSYPDFQATRMPDQLRAVIVQ